MTASEEPQAGEETSDDGYSPEAPLPPKGFDPARATPEELDQYDLPRKPSETQPALLRAWLRLFEMPLDWVDPDVKPIEVDLVLPPQSQQLLILPTRFETSKNWCGASIVPNGGDQFVNIFGEWNVPTPSLPPADEQGPPGQKNEYQSATWIGLDGDRRYLNSSLPQVGAAQNFAVDPGKAGVPEFYAWFQWWARCQVKLTFETIRGVHIKGGLRVMGLISVINPFEVRVVFRNFAPLNQITRFRRHSPKVRLSTGQIIQPSISGATAEWIMERPTARKLAATDLDLFPSYSAIRFDHCVAGVARAPGGPTSEEVLTGPRYKRMFEISRDAPSRTRFISMPEPISTTSFKARYGGFRK
jgi:hypothetical protein